GLCLSAVLLSTLRVLSPVLSALRILPAVLSPRIRGVRVLPPCVLPAISPLVGMALSARVVVTARQPELRQAGLKPALPLPHLVVRFRSSPVLGSRSGANFGILGP